MKIKRLHEQIKPTIKGKFTLDESLFSDWEEDTIINTGNKSRTDKKVIPSEKNLDDDYDSVFALLNSLDDDVIKYLAADVGQGNIMTPTVSKTASPTMSMTDGETPILNYDDDFSPGEGDLATPIDEPIKDVEEEIPQPPKTDEDNGVAELIMDAIKDEYEAISFYNSITLTLKDLGREDCLKLIADITNEEMLHVGQLQELLKMVSPNAVSIEDGEEEAQEQLPDTDLNTEPTEDPLGNELAKRGLEPLEMSSEDIDDDFLLEAESIEDDIAKLNPKQLKDTISSGLKQDNIFKDKNGQEIITAIFDAIPQNSLEDVSEAIDNKIGNKKLTQKDANEIEGNAEIPEDQQTKQGTTVEELTQALNISELVNEDPETTKTILTKILSIISISDPKPIGEIITAIIIALPDTNLRQAGSALIRLNNSLSDVINLDIEKQGEKA